MAYRILFLADIDSSHTRKWATSLSQRGYTIGIFSLRKGTIGWTKNYPAIHVFDSEGFSKEKFHSADTGKISYLKLSPLVREVIAEFKPDIVHAHYATSYGLLGARSGFHPLIISAWGSDIFEFPKKSWMHRFLLKRNLKKADAVFSTSEVMKREVQALGIESVFVTPFGIDLDVYKPQPPVEIIPAGMKVIGTIKTLEKIYGIDVLIRAFEIVKSQFMQPLKLMICGAGTQEKALKDLAATSKFSSDIIFTGMIPQDTVPGYLNRFDVFVNLSFQESFGVAVLEAMACEVPVVVSDAPGLLEITANGEAGIVIPAGNHVAAAEAILKVLNDDNFAAELSAKGRARVRSKYNWINNLDEIESLYADVVKQVNERKKP